MSVLDFSGKCPGVRTRWEGQEKKKKKRTQGSANILPGQGELMAQGGVTQQSGFQDFQRMTAPFFDEKEAFTGN